MIIKKNSNKNINKNWITKDRLQETIKIYKIII